MEMVFVWKQNYILVDEYFFFCCTWIVNSADIKISLRYDGKDALNHEIDLNCLGESLKGFSKVLSTAASFSVTQKYSKYINYQEVKVYAREAKANCFTLEAVLNFATQNQLFLGDRRNYTWRNTTIYFCEKF
ncbi:hypothetical protein SM978_08600 [Escherichia coli]|nr:hypothetical protein [Escherichia coli]